MNELRRDQPTRRTLAAIGGFALFVRLAYVAIFLRHYRPDSDARQYVEMATSVAHGKGLTNEFPFWFVHASAFRPPLYPLFLGLMFRLSGDRLLVGMLANVVIGAVVVVLIAMLGARVGGKNVAIAAGILAALTPSLLFNDGVALSEPLSLLLMVAAILLLFDGRDIAAAATTGLLMLTRPSAQALALIFALWMLRSFGWRRALRFVLVAVTVVTPWIARNYVQLGSPLLVTSNGFNLAATYSPFVFAHNGFVDPFYAPEFQSVRYQHFTEPELDSTLRHYALHYLSEHKHDFAWHVKHNTRAWLEIAPSENDSPERIDGRPIGFVHATLPIFYATLALGLVGLWLGRRRSALRLTALVGAYFGLASITTVAAPRLRAPVDVVFDVAAAVAIAAVVRRYRNRDGAKPWAERGDSALVRPSDRDRNRVFLGCVAGTLAVVLGITLFARAKVEHDARREARSIAVEARHDIDQVASQYPVGANAQKPGFDVGAAPDRLKVLDGRLWELLPKAAAGDRPSIRTAAEALYDVQARTRVLGLLIARIAFTHPGPWTAADARKQYVTEVRSNDPTLPPWPELLAGRAAERARRALIALAH